jgi:DNA primase
MTELYTRVGGSFHYWLMEKSEGRAAKEYITARGISQEMLDRFRLGYAPANKRWLFAFLTGKGYSQDFLVSSGLFSSKYPQVSFFSNRLMFPIADRQGRTIAFGARLLSGEGPKYLNSAESDFYKKGQTLFALDMALSAIRSAKAVYIAEGYMDVIALHQAGITNAVAPLGTAFTDEQAKLLRRWADQVYLIFDADNAGQNAVLKAILTCRRNGLVCSVVIPGKGLEKAALFKDPADILKEAGSEVLQKNVKSCILDFEYLVNRSRSLFDISSAEGKAQAIAFLFPYLETLDSEISKDLVIGQAADVFGVDRGAILNDFNRRNRVHRRGEQEVPKQAEPIRMNDELYLLTVVSVNDRLYPKFRTKLLIKDLEDPAAKELFIALEECFIHDESGMEDLLARISSESLRNFVIERGTSREFSANPEQLVLDGIKKVKQKRLHKRLTEIVTELRMLEHVAAETHDEFQNGIRMEELLAEKMHIDTELRRLKEENP